MTAPSRPLLRWLGGKYRLAEWIIGHFPDHLIYLEPFGGAASVLLRKPRAYNEILNDLDDDLVNLYRVLREPSAAAELIRRLALTAYAESEYLVALKAPHSSDLVERARRLVVRSFMAHGSNAARADRPTGFRSDGRSGTTNVAGEWADFPTALAQIVDRLRGVTIRQDSAQALLDEYRDPKVLIYLDPPYMAHTRSDKSRQGGEGHHTYAHELSDDQHAALLDQICDHPAMIVISGYDAPLYRERLVRWDCRAKSARAHRNLPRTELLWLNPLCSERLSAGPLFHPRNPHNQPDRPQPGAQKTTAARLLPRPAPPIIAERESES